MTAKKPAAKVTAKWKNRIVEYGEVRAGDLLANPANARRHSETQKAAMTGVLEDIGWIAPLIVNKTSGLILDGHMRADLDDEAMVPVAWVELDETEERTMLAVYDPIGQMAEIDTAGLDALLDGIELSDGVASALDGLLSEPEDDEPAEKPVTVELRGLQRAHILVSVPIDDWDLVSPILDQLDGIEGVSVASTVN